MYKQYKKTFLITTITGFSVQTVNYTTDFIKKYHKKLFSQSKAGVDRTVDILAM